VSLGGPAECQPEEREEGIKGRGLTLDIAEFRVGFGAELFAPKRRFMFAEME
jgi:hypothetical protein